MFDIKQISEEENAIISRAKDQYGILLDTAVDTLKLSWTFPKLLQIDAWIFAGFLSQSNNSLYLSLLSTLRKHAAQSNFNARLSIEASIMACYALREKEINSFVQRDDSGKLKSKQNAKSKAYKWVEQHYKEHSDRLEAAKKEINETFAHSNLQSIFGHFELNEVNRQSYSWFFDITLDRDVHFQLLKFISLVLTQVTMYKDVIKDYPLVQLRDDFAEDYDRIFETNQMLTEYYKVIAQEIANGNLDEIPVFQIL